MLITKTNNALDKFLRHFLGFSDKIMRIGGPTNDEKLAAFNLSALEKEFKLQISKRKGLDQQNASLNLAKVKLFNRSNLTFENFLQAFPMENQIKFKKEISGYFSQFGINFPNDLHSQTLEALFSVWKNSEPMTVEKFKRIMKSEKKLNQNNATKRSKRRPAELQLKNKEIRLNNPVKSLNNILGIKYIECEELGDLDFLKEMTETEDKQNFIDFFNPQTVAENYFYFFSMGDEERENLAKNEFFFEKNIWDLNSNEREKLLRYAFFIKHPESYSKFKEELDEFIGLNDEIEEECMENVLNHLQRSEIIGMTVNQPY